MVAGWDRARLTPSTVGFVPRAAGHRGGGGRAAERPGLRVAGNRTVVSKREIDAWKPEECPSGFVLAGGDRREAPPDFLQASNRFGQIELRDGYTTLWAPTAAPGRHVSACTGSRGEGCATTACTFQSVLGYPVGDKGQRRVDGHARRVRASATCERWPRPVRSARVAIGASRCDSREALLAWGAGGQYAYAALAPSYSTPKHRCKGGAHTGYARRGSTKSRLRFIRTADCPCGHVSIGARCSAVSRRRSGAARRPSGDAVDGRLRLIRAKLE